MYQPWCGRCDDSYPAEAVHESCAQARIASESVAFGPPVPFRIDSPIHDNLAGFTPAGWARL